MSEIGQAIAGVGDAHARILSELSERPLAREDIAAATGLSGQMIGGALTVLERGGKVRYARGLYELTRVHVLQSAADDAQRGETTRAAAETIAGMRATKAPIRATPAPIRETPAAAPAPKPAQIIPEIIPQPAMPERSSIEPPAIAPTESPTTGENDMPTGVYDRSKTAKPAKAAKAPKQAKVERPPRAPDPAAPLLIPASREVGAELVDGHVQIAHDETNLVQLSPAQMDRVAAWWAIVRASLD